MASIGGAGYGDFSDLSKSYNRGRRDFPQDTLTFILRATSVERPDILDLGCGTGIATRQLAARHARVVGCDKNLAMLEQALRHKAQGGAYCYGRAEDIPFPDVSFDVVTCFSAFHWFAHEKALHEMWRVLRSGGVLAVVNKNEPRGGFKDRWRASLKDLIGATQPDAKRDYDPRSALHDFGFACIRSDVVSGTERFTIEEALTYLESTSIWNLVPPIHRQDARGRLRDFCLNEASGNVVKRELNVKTVVGLKMIH